MCEGVAPALGGVVAVFAVRLTPAEGAAIVRVGPNGPISELSFALTDPPKRAGSQGESEM